MYPLSLLLLLAVSDHPAPAPAARTPSAQESTAETRAERDARMAWFREARFGMFVHWGLYSQLAGEWKDRRVEGAAEWIQELLGIPTSEYEALAETWVPDAYDPRAWVRLMKSAGVRYLCITSKHHDGFCLWPTATTPTWSVAATPGGRDLLGPLAEACREEGVRFCLYYSVLDWHHPDWPVRPAFHDRAPGPPDKERYKREVLEPHLRELLSRHGELGMLWLDGTWQEAWTSEDGAWLEALVRELRPDVVLNNRSGFVPEQPQWGFEVKNPYGYLLAGDYISPEGEVPPTGLPGIDWETCQTMQLPNNWGYNRTVGFRPFRDLLRQLVDVASKGGNLLLNVGPDADGALLPQTVACLERFAAWMEPNAESIHGTTASPLEALPFDGRCTRRGERLYLHVFEWPESGRLSVPVANEVRGAHLLADPSRAPLTVERNSGGLLLTLPATPPDPIDSVIALDLVGEVEPLPVPTDLARGLPVSVSGTWPGRPELLETHITDGDPATLWAPEEEARSAWVLVELDAPRRVVAAVAGDAPYGRTRRYRLEAEVNGAWRELASGTRLGTARRMDFPEVRARRFRLQLLETNDTPTLAELQLLGF